MNSRKFIAPVLGLAVCIGIGMGTIRPAVSADNTSAGADISFVASTLNPNTVPVSRTMRPVAPGLESIQPWISAVGASVGAADLNNDGVDNEACLVDPRDDSVRLFAIPGSRSTFQQLLLTPPNTMPNSAPMGCVPTDINADGSVDVIVYYWGRSPVIFLNNGDGTRFTARELVQPSEVWNTTALNVADIDGDGKLDISVGNYFPDGAKVLDPAAQVDDRMFMQDSMSLARNAGTNRLFLAKDPSNLTFADASNALPIDSATGWTLAFGAQDLTGNSLPDLYVANDFGPDQMLVNKSTPGNPKFDWVKGNKDLLTAKSSVAGNDSFKGMGVAFTTLPNQKSPSIAVSNITSEFALQESNFLFEPNGNPSDLLKGGFPYVQRSEERGISRGGWSWDIKATDLNNDGIEELPQATGFVAGTTNRWPELQELAMANDSLLKFPGSWFQLKPGDDLSGKEPNRLWCLQPNQRFQDCGQTSGIGITDVSRGFAITDANEDGKPDVLVANQWGNSTLMTNTSATDNQSVWLKLQVPTANGKWQPAIGAKVTIESDNGTVSRQLYPANGHAGVSSSELSVGIGKANEAKATISWRDPNGALHTTSTLIQSGRTTINLGNNGEIEQR